MAKKEKKRFYYATKRIEWDIINSFGKKGWQDHLRVECRDLVRMRAPKDGACRLLTQQEYDALLPYNGMALRSHVDLDELVRETMKNKEIPHDTTV